MKQISEVRPERFVRYVPAAGAGGPAVLVTNRNPQSPMLEGNHQIPRGFATTKAQKFVHRLRVRFSGRHTRADVDLGNGTTIISAHTKEWSMERQLYSTSDTTAARVLGETIAQRMHEAGIVAVSWDIGEKRYHGRTKVRKEKKQLARLVSP